MVLPGIELRLLQDEILSILASHRDLYHAHASQDTAPVFRDSISLHILDHITKCVVLTYCGSDIHAHLQKATSRFKE
jgi:hypothetical protein